MELVAAARPIWKAGRIAEASRASRQAAAAWPDVKDGRELAASIRSQNPVVEVGVTAFPAFDAGNASNGWAARRTARLLTRSIVEVTSFSDSGNKYRAPLGELRHSGNRITLAVNPKIHWPDGQPLTAYDFARCLTVRGAATPASLAIGRDLITGISAENVYQADVDFKQLVARAGSIS